MSHLLELFKLILGKFTPMTASQTFALLFAAVLGTTAVLLLLATRDGSHLRLG